LGVDSPDSGFLLFMKNQLPDSGKQPGGLVRGTDPTHLNPKS
jgi:hypothetical protein